MLKIPLVGTKGATGKLLASKPKSLVALVSDHPTELHGAYPWLAFRSRCLAGQKLGEGLAGAVQNTYFVRLGQKSDFKRQ